MKTMVTIKKIDSGKKEKYCSFCDYTGILRNSFSTETGEVPLSPCPKCVLSKCSCGGISPYYYYKEGEIKECYCREIRMKIDRINITYSSSGIDRKYRWRFITSYESINKATEEAKSLAYDIIT